jgi:enamine deaminase RidA (YjgF/YER057c/UK114 family)
MKNQRTVTLSNIIAIMAADIETFLLMDESQENDNDKEFFTREEIRAQLRSSVRNIAEALVNCGADLDKPLSDTFHQGLFSTHSN